ncbi:hypothetical protein Vafri_6622, partial [Volvox africanus]
MVHVLEQREVQDVAVAVRSAPSTSSAASEDAKHLPTSDRRHKHKNGENAHLAALALLYPETSLFCIRKHNAVRKFCILVSHSTIFENVILFCILCNCITLGMSSNREGFDHTRVGGTLNKFEYLWVGIFSAEALMKIVSMGFILAPGAYLRDGWNWIDFIVVALGYVDIFSSGNLTAVRTVRVLRPLRAITRVQGMKVLVTTMIESMPMLIDVVLLCAFTFFIWGIVAVQIFAGTLKNRCAEPDFTFAYTIQAAGGGRLLLSNVSYVVSDEQTTDMCSGPLASDTSWYELPGGSVQSNPGPRGSGLVCPAGQYCAAYGNPNYGLTNFDNILWSWLTIFQCITLESWTDVLYLTSDAVSWWVWPLFVALVVFGAFFLVSLALAVIFLQFASENTETHNQERQREQEAAMRRQRRERQREKKRAQQQQRGEQKERLTEKTGKEEEERRKGCGRVRSDSGSGDGESLAVASERGAFFVTSGGGQAMGDVAAGSLGLKGQEFQMQRKEMEEEEQEKEEEEEREEEETRTFRMMSTSLSETEVEDLGALRRVAHRVAVSPYLTGATIALILINTVVMCINWYGMPYKVEQATNYINYALTGYFVVELIIKLVGFGLKRYFHDGMNTFDFLVVAVSLAEMIVDLLPSVEGMGALSVLRLLRLLRVFRLMRIWRELYVILHAILRSVMSTAYLLLLLLLFLFISALMGMQLFGYKFMFCDYVEGARAVCPLGQRVWGDCPNHFYCYLPCSENQNGTWIDAPGSFYNGLAYCDSFCASASAGDAAGGGCEYLAMVGKSQVPRANFDNVLWGMFTVFQLLTGENWNNVMYDSMRTTTAWAALYYIIVILLGTYLVFNLFIAILLDNFTGAFSSDAQKDGDDSYTQQKLEGSLDAATQNEFGGGRAGAAPNPAATWREVQLQLYQQRHMQDLDSSQEGNSNGSDNEKEEEESKASVAAPSVAVVGMRGPRGEPGDGWARGLSVVLRNATAATAPGPGAGDVTSTSVEPLNRFSWFQSLGRRSCGYNSREGSCISRDGRGNNVGGGRGGGGGARSSWNPRSMEVAAAGGDCQGVSSHKPPELNPNLQIALLPPSHLPAPPPPPPMRVLRFGDTDGAYMADGGRITRATINSAPSSPRYSALTQSGFGAGVDNVRNNGGDGGDGGDDGDCYFGDSGDSHHSSVTTTGITDGDQRQSKAAPTSWLVLPSVRVPRSSRFGCLRPLQQHEATAEKGPSTAGDVGAWDGGEVRRHGASGGGTGDGAAGGGLPLPSLGISSPLDLMRELNAGPLDGNKRKRSSDSSSS